ncbi:MAG: long-chain fatty acid--CoA ligase [Lachnospiraceae bacterium]|nr:long-chain fatty acid--CoA ligase [Lachnospiraceae bacterium]
MTEETFHKFNNIREMIAEMQYRDGTALLWEENGGVKEKSWRELASAAIDKAYDLPGYADAVVWDGKAATIERILADFMAGRNVLLAGEHMERESVDGAASSLEQRQTGFLKNHSAVALFTSGTTGKPKGVILTQRSIAFSLWSGQKVLACGPGDIILSELPVYHVYGLVASLLWGLAYQATVAIGRGPGHLKEDMELFKPTILPATPRMVEGVAERQEFNKELRTLIIGGYFPGEKLIEELRSWNGSFHVGYGMTETACQIAMSMDRDEPQKLTPFPGVHIKIDDDGEICIESPSIMEGYLGEPPLMEPVFRTGDLGELDEQGRLIIKGRKKAL